MFYISTIGGSGSAWVARALTMHPHVVCFHGSMRLPPALEQDTFPNLSPCDYVEGLEHLERASHGHKLFGGSHGFPGLDVRLAIMQRGGGFGALFRHPVMRINSLWHAYRDAVPCWLVVGYDILLIRHVARDCLFRFEDVVTGRDGFAAMFERLVVPPIDASVAAVRPRVTSGYLDAVFASEPSNVRAAAKDAPDDVFARWPVELQFHLALCLQAFGGTAAADDYAKLGYRVPDALRAYAPRNVPRRLWASVANRMVHADPDCHADELERWTAMIARADYAEHIWHEFLPALGQRWLGERRGLDETADAGAPVHMNGHSLPESLEAMLAEERGQRIALQVERDAMLLSTSWRITAPLRRIVNRLQRPRA